MSLSREEIRKIAHDAGLSITTAYGEHRALERFFNAAYAAGAAAEREACAEVCDERALLSFDNSAEQCEAQDCAAAIRARGDK